MKHGQYINSNRTFASVRLTAGVGFKQFMSFLFQTSLHNNGLLMENHINFMQEKNESLLSCLKEFIHLRLVVKTMIKN